MKYSLRSLMKFSIRDMALVTMIVALAVGWCVERGKALQIQRALLAEQERAENSESRVDALSQQLGTLGWTVIFDDNGVHFYPPWSSPIPSAPAPNPPKP